MDKDQQEEKIDSKAQTVAPDKNEISDADMDKVSGGFMSVNIYE